MEFLCPSLGESSDVVIPLGSVADERICHDFS